MLLEKLERMKLLLQLVSVEYHRVQKTFKFEVFKVTRVFQENPGLTFQTNLFSFRIPIPPLRLPKSVQKQIQFMIVIQNLKYLND